MIIAELAGARTTKSGASATRRARGEERCGADARAES
jgi:hypothetical protein